MPLQCPHLMVFVVFMETIVSESFGFVNSRELPGQRPSFLESDSNVVYLGAEGGAEDRHRERAEKGRECLEIFFSRLLSLTVVPRGTRARNIRGELCNLLNILIH